MIIDSSALVAIVMSEPGHEELLARVLSAAPVGLPAPAFAETAFVLSRLTGGDPQPHLVKLLEALDIQIIPFTERHAQLAVSCFLTFGKGRHPASLNFGDCLVYAVAKAAGEPLLFVGNDFARTDLSPS